MLVWIIVAIALLVIGLTIVTGSWEGIYNIFDKIKGVMIFG